MKVRNLEKTLRSTVPREVPADLRDRLIEAIPADFGPVQADAGPVPSRFSPTRRKLIYLAAAAVLLIAALHFTGVLPLTGPRSDRLAGTSFDFVSLAVADVIRNLEDFGALYVEIDQRTREQESFEFLNPKYDFLKIRAWLERPSERFKKGRMRIEKDTRRVVFNGDSTLIFFKKSSEAKFFKGGRIDYQLIDPAKWVEKSLPRTGASASLDTLVDGNRVSITSLTIQEKGQYPEPGHEPTFIMEFDRRTVISWETATRRLVGFERYVMDKGQEVLAARLRSIEYRDHFDDEVFSHRLPEGTHLMEVADAGNPKYSQMGPEEVANFIFTAWRNEEWEDIRLFCEGQAIINWMKAHPLASFRVSGPKFKWNLIYPGHQIPFELVFKDGRVHKGALALRNDNRMKRYVFDGGL